MAKVNENEKKLLMVLGIAAFLAANVLGYFLIADLMKGLTAQKKSLTEELAGLERAKSQASEADTKQIWMDENFKTYPSDEFRETYLDSLVNSDLTAGLEVELSKASVMPTDFSSEFCVRSRFRVNVKGPWGDIYKFIYRLQQPKEFRFVPQILVVPKKAESDDSVQVAEAQVTIEKWWRKPEGTVNEGENILAPDEQKVDGAVNNAGGGSNGAGDNPTPGSSNEGAALPPPPADPNKPAPSAPPAAPENPPGTPPADTNSPKPNP